MKTVTDDGTYIDYTHGNSGVRVWENRCRVIDRPGQDTAWIEREPIYDLPIPDSILGFPHSGTAPTTALAFEVARYDDKECDPELRGLLKRWMTFEAALATR
jgi:hypothetical protein